MAVLLLLFLIFSMIYSNAAYCVCKDGGGEAVLQKAIDYACGAGADCAQIQQNGQCFQPNTVKNHCDVAVNSYYQRKASSGATCDFNGAAVLTNSPPSAAASNCLSGSGSTGTPTTGNPTNGAPAMGTPTTGNPTSTSSSSSVFPGTTVGPTGSGLGDQNAGETRSTQTAAATAVVSLTVALSRWYLIDG